MTPLSIAVRRQRETPSPDDTAWSAPLPWPEAALTAVAGIVFGGSAIAEGLYDTTAWRPLTLVVLAVLCAVIVARRAVPTGWALVAILALAGLALWSLLAGSWAASEDGALTEANRWLLYAALLAALVLLLRADPRLGLVLLAGITVAIVAVTAYVVGAMLSGDGPSLFTGARLAEPLGYVNGQAGYLLIGVWPLVALAERAPSALLSGGALAVAVVLAALLVLTQSRGVLAAAVLSAVFLLAVVPGRMRRAWALLAILGGIAICSGALADAVDVRSATEQGPALRDAARMTLVAATVVGLAWAAAFRALSLWTRRSAVNRVRLSIASAALLGAVAVTGVVALIAAVGDPAREVRERYDEFVELKPAVGPSRLAQGGGNRYDYWRIAAREFGDHPLAGDGGGSYQQEYYRERRTTENIRQPHSLVLQTLAELGLVGGILLLLFIAAVIAGLLRIARAAARNSLLAGTAVAGGGVFLVWLVHASVDWLHLIPGLAGIALCGAAAVVGLADGPEASAPAERPLRVPATAAIVVVIGLLAISVGRPAVADRLRNEGRDQIESDPAAALEKANDALKLNGKAVATYHLKAAALARGGLYGPARRTLLAAAEREPNDFVTWVLVGDLATRRGDLDAAREAYRRASELNPRDPTLRSLARDGAAIERLARDPERGLEGLGSGDSLSP